MTRISAPDGGEGGGVAGASTVDVTRRFSPLLILLLGSLWGFNTSMVKMAGLEGVPAIGLTTLQMTGAAIMLWLVCHMRGIRLRFDRGHMIYYVLVGVIGTAVPSANMVNTIRELPAGVMVLAIAMVPLMTYVGSLFMRMERFDLGRLTGVLMGFGGVLLIVLPTTSLPEPDDAGWFLIGLITPTLYAFSSIAAARCRPDGADSAGLAAGMCLVMAVALWPLALGLGHEYIPDFAEPGLADLCIAIVIAITCIAYILFFELIRAVGPVSLSVVGYVVTLTGILFGMVFFDESHSAWVWGAAGLIFLGLALVNGRQAAGALMNAVRQ